MGMTLCSRWRPGKEILEGMKWRRGWRVTGGLVPFPNTRKTGVVVTRPATVHGLTR